MNHDVPSGKCGFKEDSSKCRHEDGSSPLLYTVVSDKLPKCMMTIVVTRRLRESAIFYYNVDYKRMRSSKEGLYNVRFYV